MTFAEQLIAWQRAHGRHDLPWQGTRDPYRIWLSEVMLQQTQVATVIPYYERFLARFATVQALARASQEQVLRLWSGLGYYARGRNLHRAAKEISKSGFPRTAQEIARLPGVGRSTAAAIAVFAFGERAAILDGNVKRVLARAFGIEDEKNLWQRAEAELPAREVEAYTQGLMDLGATVCTRREPKCDACPVSRLCLARREGRVAELPSRRARKALPTKRARWFVYLHRGKVLLEQRPARGVWGGLWAFPERRVLRQAAAAKLPVVEHGFTHFRLVAQPLLHRLSATIEVPGRRWIGLRAASAAAVPAPVRTLLLRLAGVS